VSIKQIVYPNPENKLTDQHKHEERQESDDAYAYADEWFFFQTPDEFDREYLRYEWEMARDDRNDREQQRQMDDLYQISQ
jgi:hypothetical protein